MLNQVEEKKVKTLRKKLQKSFKTLQECIPAMQTCITKQESALKELCTLCEQYRECRLAAVEKLQLPPQLGDVKPRILHIIVVRIDEQLKEIRVITSEYKQLSDKIHDSRMQSFKDLPQINFLVQPNRTYPSLAIMLEWLDDCEKEVYTQLCIKNEFLSTLDFKDEDLWQKCQNEWLDGDTKILQKFEERLAHLQDFFDETV